MYDGENMKNFHSWIIRCRVVRVDSVRPQIECDKAHSTLLKKEYTDAVLEYATGKMIVHVKPTDLLLIVNA